MLPSKSNNLEGFKRTLLLENGGLLKILRCPNPLGNIGQLSILSKWHTWTQVLCLGVLPNRMTSTWIWLAFQKFLIPTATLTFSLVCFNMIIVSMIYHFIVTTILITFISYVDVIGQIVNVGELKDVETSTSPTKKLEFQLRDTK